MAQCDAVAKTRGHKAGRALRPPSPAVWLCAVISVLAAAVAARGTVVDSAQRDVVTLQGQNDPLRTAQQAKLVAADAVPAGSFGSHVAVSGDTAVVGAAAAGDSPGSAYVFVRSGTTWVQQAELTPADDTAPAFGSSVALAGDTVVIGAGADSPVDDDVGSAYVFLRSGITWAMQARLTADDAATHAFGARVALSGDTAAIAAGPDGREGPGAGSVYVFARSGTAWTQQAKLTTDDSVAGDRFGVSVALADDTVVIGSAANSATGPGPGYAHVFVRAGTAWAQQARLAAPELGPGSAFGDAVATTAETAVIGAPGAGSAVVYARSGTTWTQQATLVSADATAGDAFGSAVALSGERALVGAPSGVGAAAAAPGSAYAFARSGQAWSQATELVASDAAARDGFGSSVALSGTTALIGARGDAGGTLAGSVYVFEPTAAPTPTPMSPPLPTPTPVPVPVPTPAPAPTADPTPARFSAARSATTLLPTPSPTPQATPEETPAPPEPTLDPGLSVSSVTGDALATMTVSVPDQGQASGAFTISTDVGGTINMGTPTTGTDQGVNFLDYSASMTPVTVTDNRPGLLPWTVTGQLSNFSGSQGTLVFARYMGWIPEVITPGIGAAAPASLSVSPGYPGFGTGLHDSRILAFAQDGHGGTEGGGSANLGSTLNLHVPTTVPAGSYQAVLTLTALS